MATTDVERFRRARKDSSLAVLEGFHALKHALRFDAEILDVVQDSEDRIAGLAQRLAPDVMRRLATSPRTLSAEAFARLAPAAPATGVLALARRPEIETGVALARVDAAPIVLLERPTHHANLGAVVRVAAAADAAAVLCIGAGDPWHPAALRGSAGLHFALPVARVEADSPFGGRPLVALDPDGEALQPGALPARAILAFGSERRGLSSALLERADRRIAIPMREGVSSLNLATAVAIALYALSRPD